MSLRAKFWIAFGVIAILTTVLAAGGLRALNATSRMVVRLYDEPLMGVNYARAASTSLSEARGVMERALLTGPGEAPLAVAALWRMQTDIKDDLRIVQERVHDADVATALDRAKASIADWFANGRAILAPPATGVAMLPMPALVERQGAVAMSRLDDLVEMVAANGFAYRARAESDMRAAALNLTALSGGIILTCGLFALLLARLLIRPVRAATRIAEDVAAGNNALIVITTRRDEIGRLLASLATMQANLRNRDARALALTLEKAATAEVLQETNLRFDIALSNMRNGLLMCDGDARVIVVNRRFGQLYNVDLGNLQPNSPYRDLLAASVAAGNYPGRTVDDILLESASVLQSGLPANTITTIAGDRAIAASYEPMPNGGWIATYDDITERLRSEEQVAFLAWHDGLTKLPNRVLFQDRLEQALARAVRGQGFALLFLDLDRFKAVNDTLGHPIGDILLCQVAGRLQDLVREADSVARLGGDEFAILQLGAATAADATVLARRLIQIVTQPYELEGHHVTIGTSIGIAMVPAGGGGHPSQLLKEADLALYRAKQEGRGTWSFFETEMDTSAKTRRALEVDLRSALPLGQLEVYYQPVVSSETRTVTGFEALLRWHHPTRGMLPPGEFIIVAEEIGVIVPIGAWVLQQACEEAATWPNHLRVAVNLSPRQFRGLTLIDTVHDALQTSGLSPARLELEITESVPLRDDETTLTILQALRALGVRIALDDFGTGYSSLSYLRSFPFDTIKIDRSFVSEALRHGESAAIVLAIIGLGTNMHVNTTAEGVETEEQLEYLIAAGCTELQGYFFSRPVAAWALPALIELLSVQPVAAFPELRAVSGD